MDAFFRGILLISSFASIGATYQSPNFVVQAPTAEFAKQVGEAAEIYRKELAVEWTGKPLPGNWAQPCPITVVVGQMGAGGKTTFNFQNGEVYGWRMEVKGSEQRILDSVLPHEINHTIFASLFRRPLPRWADEGAASLIEHESERNQLRQIHNRAIGTRRSIPLKTLLDIKQYPQDQNEVLTLYAEGHSLADFLIQRSDKPKYLKLMEMAHERGWETALKSLYGFASIDKLEKEWEQWVVAGSPKLPEGIQLASSGRAPASETTIRGQSPSSGDLTLGEAINLAAAQSPPSNSAEQPAPREITQSASSRERDQLYEPLLIINRQSTDAAKVSRE